MHPPQTSTTTSTTKHRRSEARICQRLKIMQRQAGHSWASTTAGYTTVGADHANRMLRAAVERAFVAAPQGGSR
jgi:hypothetical protein